MPVFAPGMWAGFNDSMAINRQKQRDQIAQDEQRQLMQQRALAMETERQNQARDLRARQGFGAGMYGVYGTPPPGVGTPPPAAGAPPPPGGPGGGPMPPPPGQSSAPAQGIPPGGVSPQGIPPGGVSPQGIPPGGVSPQGIPPGGVSPQGIPPGQPQQPPAYGPLERAKGDVEALNRELSRPGLNSEQRQIITSELGKAQERLAQLSGQQMPYRAVPTAGAQPQGGPPPAMGTQAPPPIAPSQPQQPSLLKRFVQAAQQNGVPPEDLADQIKMLSPIMQDEMKQELMTLRGTQAEQNLYIRQLMGENAFHREDRLTTQGDRKGDQKDRQLDQAEQRIKDARAKAEAGSAPTTSELDDPETAKVWLEKFKVDGKNPPFAWGKAGQKDRETWIRLVGKSGSTGGEIAAGQAEGKARTSALAANEKRNVGLEVGANETLRDMATMDSIIERVATKGGAKVLNRPLNKLRDLGSDPEYGELELVTKQVAMKYERMLAGGILSVAQLHEGAREDAKKIMNGDMTVAEIRAKLPLMKREMENAQKAGKATSADVKGQLAGKDSNDDAAAIAWAKANPKDPRAAKILALHPGQ